MSSEAAPENTPSTPCALEAIGLGKCYHIYATPRDRLKQLSARITGRQYFREFWALKDVSFSLAPGQTLGIIGPNGSGKSTLLQLIAGILVPSSGSISVKGRVAALLELGSGFNPEFTGKENIYMNAAILGYSRKEVDARYDAITAFADIGDFLDRPVKTYSSGMYVRLAFSVAVNVDPDILIVDEALAVGDIKFQARCFRKFEEFQNSGKTILFVSHSAEHIVRHCTHAILLHQGRLIAQGEPREITNQYRDLTFNTPRPGSEASAAPAQIAGAASEPPATGPQNSADALDDFLDPASAAAFESRPSYNELEYRWGDRSAEILDYLVRTPAGCHAFSAASGDSVDVFAKIRFHRDVPRPIYGFFIKSPDGVLIFSTNSKDAGLAFQARRTGEIVTVHFEFQAFLNSGNYLLSLGIVAEQDATLAPLDRRYDAILLEIQSAVRTQGIVILPHHVEIVG